MKELEERCTKAGIPIDIHYFQCSLCGCILRIDQSPFDENKLIYPEECYENQGGCGRCTKHCKFYHLKQELFPEKNPYG